MTKRKTCDKCLHYRSNQNRTGNSGRCALMGDANQTSTPEDGVVAWDSEGYRAGCYVGPKFGCIHWKKNP